MEFQNNYLYICPMTNKATISIAEQLRIALDGRTQRWLSKEVKIPEDLLSKKMKGVINFTDEEINAINTRLKSNIKK